MASLGANVKKNRDGLGGESTVPVKGTASQCGSKAILGSLVNFNTRFVPFKREKYATAMKPVDRHSTENVLNIVINRVIWQL